MLAGNGTSGLPPQVVVKDLTYKAGLENRIPLATLPLVCQGVAGIVQRQVFTR